MTEKNTSKKASGIGATVATYFAFGLLSGLAWGLIYGIVEAFASAAFPYGMFRLAIETVARDVGDGLRWGVIWGLVASVYGFALTKISGDGRRAVIPMLMAVLFWLLGIVLFAAHLVQGLEQKLPLPYQDHVTPRVFLTRFIWPLVSFTVTVKPVLVLALLFLSFLIPAALALGVFFMLRGRLPKKPFGRIPSLAMTRKTAIAAGAVVFLGIAVIIAPKAMGRPQGAPNVLMVSIDTLRADGLSCYGNKNLTSPVIDKLAEKGTRYENFYSHAPWTLPGHVSMLTGLIPDVHGTYLLDRQIPREAPLLAEVFKNAGFHTFAMTSNFLVSPPYGFGRGFDRFLFRPEAEAREVNDGAMKLINRAREPWFGFVHYFDPHLPYSPTPASRRDLGIAGPTVREVDEAMTHLLYRFVDIYLPYDQEKKDIVRLLYDGEVRDVDRALGGLLKGIRDRFGLDNTIVIITADHGEEFFEHGWNGHSVALHDESLRVPLILAGKGVAKGVVRQEITSMSMLPPLVMDLAGLADPLKRDWRKIREHDNAYGHTNAFGNHRYSYRNGGWTFLTETDFTYGERPIQRPPMLFDDRAEINDLLAAKPAEADKRRDDMDHYVGRELKAYGQMESSSVELDETRTDRLRELGYIN